MRNLFEGESLSFKSKCKKQTRLAQIVFAVISRRIYNDEQEVCH